MAITAADIQQLLARIHRKEAQFSDTLRLIDTHYTSVPTAFSNGEKVNAATENQGSAKVFAFAQLHQLSQEQTLQLFAEHYDAVMLTPKEANHQNIRQFILHGWAGIAFAHPALQAT